MDNIDYYNQLRQSKICVSPFGWAEPCHRDVEAILCGCAIVKPRCTHVETLPDIYVDDSFMIECREDFADLGNVVLCALGIESTSSFRAEMQYRKLCEQSTPVVIAKHIYGVIERCMKRANL
jgi:hypothetical protein